MVGSSYFHPSSSSTPRGKSFLSVLRRTRKIINDVVKPHPSFEFPLSPCPQRSSATHMIRNPPQPSNTGWDASNPSTAGCDNPGVKSDLSSTLSPCNQHIYDRNGRHQGTIGRSRRTSVLRRTKGTICSPSLNHDENAMNFLTPSFTEYRPLIATVALSGPYHPRPDPLTPILEQADSPNLASNMPLSCSSADSLGVSSADSAIHFVDDASGTVISRVQRASGSRISSGQFVLEPSSLTSSLSLHIGSPPSCAAADIDAHVESLPSFVLTLPTPVSPQTHIFSPETHFTTERLFNAAESAAPGSVPSCPHCDHVLGGKLCRACEEKLLACHVWLQNAGTRAQASLPERTAEDSTRTRTVRASMGSGVSSSGVGLGLTECWDEGNDAQDDEDDIDDPGSLAIEVPPPESSRLALLSRRVKAILRKARTGFGLLFPTLSAFPLDTTHRKPA